jgi:hypothetical protein
VKPLIHCDFRQNVKEVRVLELLLELSLVSLNFLELDFWCAHMVRTASIGAASVGCVGI